MYIMNATATQEYPPSRVIYVVGRHTDFITMFSFYLARDFKYLLAVCLLFNWYECLEFRGLTITITYELD